jgi:glyoxylase-like metal-dependent hydrolase (beta-lactamase superfamily II)
MSLVLRTGGPEILVTADALYTRHALETGHLPAHMEDPHLFRRSLREIQIYDRQHPDSVVIPGHDFEAWEELPAVFD